MYKNVILIIVHADLAINEFSVFQDGIYFRIGQLMAISFVTQGNGFNLMSRSMYKYICGTELSKIIFNMDDIPDDARPMCRAVSYNTLRMHTPNAMLLYVATDHCGLLLVQCANVEFASMIKYISGSRIRPPKNETT